MSEKESDKNFVTTTCRVPKGHLHAEVSRKMIGTSDSFQSVIIGDGLKEYVRRDKKVRMIPEADVSEHARLGAAIMAAQLAFLITRFGRT